MSDTVALLAIYGTYVVAALALVLFLERKRRSSSKVECPKCDRTVDATDETCRWCRADLRASRAAPAALRRVEADLVASMTPPQRELFLVEMAKVRKDRSTATRLCLLLGGLGAHHFYLGHTVLGVIYLVLSWTLIPLPFSLVEALVIGDQTDQLNTRNARRIAARIRADSATPSAAGRSDSPAVGVRTVKGDSRS